MDQIHNNYSGREDYEKYGEELRDYMSGDGRFDNVQVYEIKDEIGDVASGLRILIEGDKKLKERNRESEVEEGERKEYERLRKKYEKLGRK